jgi:hypothetical protein
MTNKTIKQMKKLSVFLFAFFLISFLSQAQSRWTIGSQNTPLPVELLNFTALCKNQNILVEWSTASETNNFFFTIERSLSPSGGGAGGGFNWNSIATINGAGNSNNLLNYSFTDILPSPNGEGQGVRYYRLKQTDFNGAFTYSGIVYTSCNNSSFEYINVYPNPAHDHFNCDIISEENTVIDIYITNNLGQSGITKKIDVKKGENSFSIDVSKLMHATYYFKIEAVDGLFKYGKQILIR